MQSEAESTALPLTLALRLMYQLASRLSKLAGLAFVAVLAACSTDTGTNPLGIDVVAPASTVLPALPSEVRSHAVAAPEVTMPASSGIGFATMSSVVPSNATNYAIVIDPRNDQVIAFGQHLLSVPANTLCDVKTVTTGTGSCKKATKPVSVTISTWIDAAGKLNIAFDKPLRFAPNSLGQLPALYLYDPAAAGSTTSAITSCTIETGCTDTSTGAQRTLKDKTTGYVYRSIDTFLGYNVWA